MPQGSLYDQWFTRSNRDGTSRSLPKPGRTRCCLQEEDLSWPVLTS